MNTDFYTNLQVDDFEQGFSIRYANPECTQDYIDVLEERGLEYKIIEGVGLFGLGIVICSPNDFDEEKRKLEHQIKEDEEILERRKSALYKLEGIKPCGCKSNQYCATCFPI